jgi:DNA repair protein RecO (recombination protein O)
MITWRDAGLILATRRHGEADLILDALTAEHGRVTGVVRGGGGRKRAQLQPGASVTVEFRARLETHMGALRIAHGRDRAGAIMGDASALAALASAAAMLIAWLPEREPAPAVHAATEALADALAAGGGWPEAYVRWELGLLSALGFGLDLERCAATGATQDLVWVSPRTGRAVSAAAGAPYADRLLPLPRFLRAGPGTGGDAEQIAQALRLTGHFLSSRVAPAFGQPAPPPARARLAERLGAAAPRA